MISFSRFTLNNGLRVLVHEDRSTPLVAMNVLYNVGARDEDPEMTGLAHLFEHLMFSGSVGIPEYDLPLQLAGGESNAFTSNDITSYYLTVPADNIETGFWLESDRMSGIDLSQRNLDTQKSVVIEEFNQRYLNQPYGDALLLLRPLAYKVHPYRWPTIGSDITHVKNADLDTASRFFISHYAPNNAILTLSGNIDAGAALQLAEKWFGPIAPAGIRERNLPSEPEQKEQRRLEIEKDVPSDALYKAWHMGPRQTGDFYSVDLITDLLAGGESGRLHTILVRQQNLFSDINAYITSEIDPGLIILEGRLMKGINIKDADNAVTEVINDLKKKAPGQDEMEKVKNKFEASTVLTNTSVLTKALSLSFFELLGNPDFINSETDRYRAVTPENVKEAASKYFTEENCSTLYYLSGKK
ncbi:MAG: pitrilysin family protein [Bacteroidales bacterium]